jgi:hypothetical protein
MTKELMFSLISCRETKAIVLLFALEKQFSVDSDRNATSG